MSFMWSPRRNQQQQRQEEEEGEQHQEQQYERPYEQYDEYYQTANGADGNDDSDSEESDYVYDSPSEDMPLRQQRTQDLRLGDSDSDSESHDQNRRQQNSAPPSAHGPPPTQNVFQHHPTPRTPEGLIHSPLPQMRQAATHWQSPSARHEQREGQPLDIEDEDDVSDGSIAEPTFMDTSKEETVQEDLNTSTTSLSGPKKVFGQMKAPPPESSIPKSPLYVQKSPLSHLTRRRPLDPVFKAAEGSFPLLVEGDRALRARPSSMDIKVFDPSFRSTSTRSLCSVTTDPGEGQPSLPSAPYIYKSGNSSSSLPVVVVDLNLCSGDSAQGQEHFETETDDGPAATVETGGRTRHGKPPRHRSPSGKATRPQTVASSKTEQPSRVDQVPSEVNARMGHNDVLVNDDFESQELASIEISDDFVQVDPSTDDLSPEHPDQNEVPNNEFSDRLNQEQATNDLSIESEEDEGEQMTDDDIDDGELVGAEDACENAESYAQEDDDEAGADVDEKEDEQEGAIKASSEAEGKQREVITEEQFLTPDQFNTPDKPIRQSRFAFLSDENKLPSDLKKLQEKALRRRREFLSRMHDLDCQMASITAAFGDEKMDLDLAIYDALDRNICGPLEAAAERIVIERETSSCRTPAVTALGRRVEQLDNLMTNHIHVTLSDAKRDELDALHDQLIQDTIPGIHMENSKSDKIELGIARRLDAVAGMLNRRFHEESAARQAAIDKIRKKVEHSLKKEERRSDDLLATITDLRAQIKKESATRKAQDQKIIEEIIQTTAAMKRALLAAVSGGSTD